MSSHWHICSAIIADLISHRTYHAFIILLLIFSLICVHCLAEYEYIIRPTVQAEQIF